MGALPAASHETAQAAHDFIGRLTREGIGTHPVTPSLLTAAERVRPMRPKAASVFRHKLSFGTGGGLPGQSYLPRQVGTGVPTAPGSAPSQLALPFGPGGMSHAPTSTATAISPPKPPSPGLSAVPKPMKPKMPSTKHIKPPKPPGSSVIKRLEATALRVAKP